jgi:hypothetical protein
VPVRTELSLRLPNSPGSLAAVCGILGREGVAITALGLEAGGQLRLVVDNHVRASGALRDAHHKIVERDVLVVSVSNEAGGLAAVARLIAESGVNVEYAYGGASDSNARGVAVLGVADPARASAAAGV